MKILGNCYSKYFTCPFLRHGAHSGFTGAGGPITWWKCLYHGSPAYLRNIKKCDCAGVENKKLQKDLWLKFEKGEPC